MTRKAFEKLVAEGFARVPLKFRKKIKNVGFLVEDEPSAAVRKEVGLRPDETLLGFYRGIPRIARGGEYGVGPTLPDVIYIYRRPTEEESRYRLAGFSNNKRSHTIAKEPSSLFHSRLPADASAQAGESGNPDSPHFPLNSPFQGNDRTVRRAIQSESERFREAVREVVAETVWHEVGHYFGLSEEAVARKEKEQEAR